MVARAEQLGGRRADTEHWLSKLPRLVRRRVHDLPGKRSRVLIDDENKRHPAIRLPRIK